MRNFIDELGINGHLTIIKRDNNGKEEVIFDDHNIIVSGMGVGLSYLFTASGSTSIIDYQIDRFQLGVSGGTVNEVSSTYNLSSPLVLADYGSESQIFLKTATQIEDGVDQTGKAFALIPAHKVTKINDTSVRYTLVVDEETANGLTGGAGEEVSLSEIGLFMKNPTGRSGTEASILVAYRAFSKIVKTSDFSLIFRWTVNF